MRIDFFEIMPGEEEILSALAPAGHTIRYHHEALTLATAHLAQDADIVSVFVQSELRKELLDTLPTLKLITTRSMGFEHIDVPYARSRSIRAINVTTYASHPVAEFTFALLLAVTRRIVEANDRLREQGIFDTAGLQGRNLFGKTLGIVGTGRIGQNVARIAHGFGMKIIAYDVHPDTSLAAQLGMTYLPLADLISTADIVTVHVPSTPETYHLIDAAMFSHFKKGSILINTARGEIVDTHALIAALGDGTLRGAGLDVLEGERQLRASTATVTSNDAAPDYPLVAANHVLLALPSVVVTPHIAFETDEALNEIARATIESIKNFIAGTEQHYL